MEEIQKTENFDAAMAPNVIRVDAATGDLRLHEFPSRTFRNTRFLRVWLPPGYDQDENSSRRYPVLYLNDGQNLFEPSTSFTGVEWGVDETADRLIRDRIVPPMIIVGIDHAAKDRFREYMPYRSLQPMMLRVQGQRYPNFLIKEVMPFIARNYQSRIRAREHWPGRFVVGCIDFALYRCGAAWNNWASAAGEPVFMGFESPDDPREPRNQALA